MGMTRILLRCDKFPDSKYTVLTLSSSKQYATGSNKQKVSFMLYNCIIDLIVSIDSSCIPISSRMGIDRLLLIDHFMT